MAPLLAALAAKGLDLIGGAVLAKGQEFVEAKLGVKLDEEISTDQAEKLRSLQFEHEEELLRIAVDHRKLDLESYKIEVEDRGSARTMGAELANSKSWLNQNIVPFLAIVVVFGGGVMIWQAENSELRMVGSNLVTLVLAYYFGSSSGSKAKQELIEGQIKK